MIPPIRLLIPALIVCAQPLAAQKLSFHGIPWHISADSVRAAVGARGFTFAGDAGDGDHAFTRADGARLIAEMRDGRLVGFRLIDAARGDAVDGRFQVLADSLQAELGAPDVTEDDEVQGRWREWVAGLWSVEVGITRAGGQRAAQVMWRGPGRFDEMGRRAGYPPQPAGFTTVSISPFMRIAVDTTLRGRAAADSVRGRFRIAWFQPITPTVEGEEQAPLDAVEYEMDFGCTSRRTRLISRTTFLDGQRQGTNRPRGQPWTTPRQPDGHYARGLDAVCRARRPVR